MEKKAGNERNEIGKDDLVSVPFGGRYLQGIVKDIQKDHLIIENYGEGKVKIPNNKLVYKFFPGQKFDLRELNIVDQNSKDKLSLKDRLDSFLSKTEQKGFDALMKNNPKQVGQLLAGKLTSEVYKGSSMVQKPDENFKTMVNWAAKFQLYRAKDQNLKLDIKFQQEKLKLDVYGKDVTNTQLEEMKDKGQTVTLERTTNNGKDFKVFASFDKDLNRIVTRPYSEKIEERIKLSQAKNNKLEKAQKNGQKKTAGKKV